MLKDNVRKIVKGALGTDEGSAADFTLERPAQEEHGDYAIFAGENSENLKSELEKSDLVERVEIVSGFVNIFLKPEVWQEEISRILELRTTYAHLTLGRERTVNVEFVSANPTGELHVGTGRGVFFGDVLSNVLEKAGYNVEREYFVNDSAASLQIQELGKTALGKGESYKSDYLDSILKELKPDLEKIEDTGKAGYIVAQRVLKDIKSLVTDKLKIKIDRWFSENDLHETGQIAATRDKVPTYEKDDAVWAKTKQLGDDEDRVLVRSDGTPGYFLADIAYHLDKAGRADIIVEIWGADHQGHVKRMYAIGKHLGFADKLQILITQIVRIKESGEGKKMSKRAGNLVSLKWLVDEVGLDAARWFYLSKSLSTHMDFDVALAKEQSQKNPVYYVQYSYARSNQIFEKSEGDREWGEADVSLLADSAELSLVKKLSEYPEMIETIVTGYEKSKSYDLQKLTTYAYELSSTFHKFYETSHVLVKEEKLRYARLALVRAYQLVLKDCLDLLGINAPEKM